MDFDSSDFALKGEVQAPGSVTVAVSSYNPFSSSILDEDGNVGTYSDQVIGLDGLMFAECEDEDCKEVKIARVDQTGDVGSYTSMAIGLDDLPIISYYDVGDKDLKVAHCTNTTCSSSGISTVDSVGNVGLFTSISIGVDGLLLINYYDVTAGNLKLTHCSNVSFGATDSIMTVDWPGQVGKHSVNVPSIDGLPIIIHYDDTSEALKAMRCAKVGCAIS